MGCASLDQRSTDKSACVEKLDTNTGTGSRATKLVACPHCAAYVRAPQLLAGVAVRTQCDPAHRLRSTDCRCYIKCNDFHQARSLRSVYFLHSMSSIVQSALFVHSMHAWQRVDSADPPA